MAQIKRITASDILENFRVTPRTDIVIDRLQKVESRKREEEESRLTVIDSFRELSLSGAEAKRKHKIAKIGGFEGDFFKFLFQPELAQAGFEEGIKEIQADPSKLGDNFFDKIITGIGNLFKKEKS